MTTDDAAELLRAAADLQRQNRLAEAIDVYRRLLARWPERAQSWFNLALLQRQVRDLEGALASYQKALAAGIDRPEEVHLNRGVIYTDYLHDHRAGERELRIALTLNPAYVPALMNYANLCEDLGRRAEAIALYLRALQLDGACFTALARLAYLQPPATGRVLAAPLGRALAHPQATAADRASLGFALGHVLDAAGDYPGAFSAYAKANQESRASAAKGLAYSRDRQHAFVDRLIAASASADVGHPLGTSTDPGRTPRPLFVCGMFRSGSTLIEQLLAALPGIAAAGELDFLPRLVEGELAPYPESWAAISPSRRAQIAAAYRDELSRVSPDARYVIDKRPDNFLYVGLIKSLFPQARIVHTIRNPLDNCLSIFFLHLDHSMSYALDLNDIAHYYREYRRLMAHWKALYPGDIYDFEYDRLVAEPSPTLGGLLEFLGIPWDGRVPQPAPAGSPVKTASVWQVREPLYRHASGRARHYARELAELRAHLADLS